MSTTPNREKTHFVPGAKKDTKLLLRCFDSVREHEQYWNKWILDEGWIDIINDHLQFPLDLRLVSADLNRAIGRSPRFSEIDHLGKSKDMGLYKAKYFERVGKKWLDLRHAM
jgi:hypothetical protein